MDVNIRKMLNMYKMFELKSDIDRLYIPRTVGGRGLTSVWDAFKSTTVRIAHVLLESDNELLSSCCDIDKKSLFSNITRAEKYMKEVSLIMSDSVKEKALLQQAKLKAACMRKAFFRILGLVREGIKHNEISVITSKLLHNQYFIKNKHDTMRQS